MEYLRGLRKLREDPEWTSKLVYGALLLFSTILVPFAGRIALTGWTALIVRRAIATPTSAEALPRLDLDFDYLGKLMGTGFKGFLAALIWGLPAGLLFAMAILVSYFGAVFGVMAAAQAGDAAVIGAICCFGAGIPAVMLLGILLGLPAQVAMVRAELADDLNQALQLGAVLDMIRKTFRELLIGSIVLSIAQTVMIFGALLLCYVPVFPAIVAAQVMRADFAAQIYQLYVERGGTPIPIGPLEVDPRVAR